MEYDGIIFDIISPKAVIRKAYFSNCDILILAGDIYTGTKGVEWIKNKITNIHVLEHESITIWCAEKVNDVTVYGFLINMSIDLG